MRIGVRHLLSVPCALALLLAVGALGASSAFAAGDANQASCPASTESSPGFRTYLPDCRAYEMVTPPFKDGVEASPFAVSGDGSRVLVDTRGAFAGTENGSDGLEGSLYNLSRTGSGWTVSAVSPSGSQFAFNALFAASADLGRTLWATRRSSQSIYAKDLYVREPDGAFVEIGPMIPPAAEAGPPAGGYQLDQSAVYAGASNDLSHVLFEIRAGYAGAEPWPGTPLGSLYEYVGTGNKQPQAVGVNAEGHSIGGSSDCPTTLGLGQQDVYNAVSADGKTVFFTSSASPCTYEEVYARLGEIETVPVSEPSPAQCAECNTAAKASAQFQGASADGSKAFFLTEQELLPGATTNNLYEYDFDNPAGKKIVRVSSGAAAPKVQGVARVSQDGSHVYFVAQEALTGANGKGKSPVAGADNLYVFERDTAYPGGRTAFVAMLCSGTEQSGTVLDTSCPSASSDQADWNLYDNRPVQATPDGRFLVFESVADLTPGDTSTEPQVFEYDALSEELVRVSIGQAGYAGGMANANAHGSSITRQSYVSTSSPTTAGRELAVSADGSAVVFASAGALVAAAEAAGAQSVYEYRSVGSISNGDVYLISDGVNTLPASQLGLDPSGGNVFFQTADPLLAQDVDTQLDIYDARAGGGFPAPGTPAVCEGEACQGAPSAQSSFGAPASVSVPGGGNVAPPTPSTPVAKPMSRAEKLARALRACRRKPKRQRSACERQAKRAYGPARKAKKSGKGGK